MEHSRRYRSRLWAGRTLLVLAVVLYGVSLVVPVYSHTDFAGWQVFGLLAADSLNYSRGTLWLDAVSVSGLLCVNVTALAVILGLTLGWVSFARAAGAMLLSTFWFSFALMVRPNFDTAQLCDNLLKCRGAWLWVASLHCLALAAFVTPRKRRPDDADGTT